MFYTNYETQSHLAKLGTALPPELVSGQLCGLVCEVCPLRTWKSTGITSISCQQLLAAVTPVPQKKYLVGTLQSNAGGLIHSPET